MDPAEYGEFVLPEIKVFTNEDIDAKVNEFFSALWIKLDTANAGTLSKDDLKTLVGEMKARLHDKEEPMEVNEAEFTAATSAFEEEVKMSDAQAMIQNKLAVF